MIRLISSKHKFGNHFAPNLKQYIVSITSNHNICAEINNKSTSIMIQQSSEESSQNKNDRRPNQEEQQHQRSYNHTTTTKNYDKNNKERLNSNNYNKANKKYIDNDNNRINRFKHKKSILPPTIITNNFSNMPTKRQYTIKYSVHAPLCSCDKIKTIKMLLLKEKEEERNNEQHDDDVNANNNNESNLNGLLVVPESPLSRDFKSKIYHCQETSREIFDTSPMLCEVKLKNEIYLKKQEDQQEQPNIKLRCAVCLLKEHKPNGFVALHSLSFQILMKIKNNITAIANKKRQLNILHSDHAHEVCILPKHLLWSYYRNRKNIEKLNVLTKVIISHLVNQGVPNLNYDNNDDNCCNYKIKLGHHLAFMLGLIYKKQIYNPSYILLLYYHDSPTKITIDLSGGKRHLGEDSWQCAIRETEEEMSLVMDDENNDDWKWNIVETLDDKRISENIYFMVNPIEKKNIDDGDDGEILLEQLKL